MEEMNDREYKLKIWNKRILAIGIVLIGLLIIWGTFFWFLINYAEEIRGNPISFATNKLNIDCICTSENIPGAYLYSNNQGNVSYFYPEQSKRSFTIDTSFLQNISVGK